MQHNILNHNFAMRKLRNYLLIALIGILSLPAQADYSPTPENLKSRAEFENDRFGIFIHWGIYSMFGQGEWYLNAGLDKDEYAKAASGFYPANFDAKSWVSAIKDSGAKYICITSRHHDGFSMWHTKQSKYNIVDATPFKRDILKELSEECERQGIALHFYYSHLDWTREDYPMGRTGKRTGRDTTKQNCRTYFDFMDAQLRELLTEYGDVRAIWFDGWWDHDEDPVPFDWELPRQYKMIHDLKPNCLIGNNHHQNTFEGEDIQIFERDVPGENTAGYSEQAISRLPLETCQTMNGMWGYKVADQSYKSVPTLIQYLVKTAGVGANLLLNVGPQPDGSLPQTALNNLKAMGKWLRENGETVYGTKAGDVAPADWGCTTRKGNRLFVHLFSRPGKHLYLPMKEKVKGAVNYAGKEKIKYQNVDGGAVLTLPENIAEVDHIIELTF